MREMRRNEKSNNDFLFQNSISRRECTFHNFFLTGIRSLDFNFSSRIKLYPIRLLDLNEKCH